MSGVHDWKCTNCGQNNSDHDATCFLCGFPKPAGPGGAGTGTTGSRRRRHMTAAHYLAMVLLGAAVVWFMSATGLSGQLMRLLPRDRFITFGYHADFTQTVVDGWLLGFIVIISSGIGFSKEGSGWIFGTFVGAVVYMVMAGVWCLAVNYGLALAVNAGMYSAIGAVGLAVVVGAAVAAVNFFGNVLLYLDPYPKTPGVYADSKRLYYEDRSRNRENNVQRRSYFFGPGYFSLWQTVRFSWLDNIDMVGNVRQWLGNQNKGLRLLLWIPGLPFFLFYAVSVLIVGSAITLVCSLVHAGILVAAMSVVYAVFSLVWVTDRLILTARRTRSMCPAHKETYLVPMFLCDKCGARHRNLVPGVYGILFHRCTCGALLPATQLTGRGRLEACCPNCTTGGSVMRLEHNVRPVSIQLVGGKSAGKTVFMAATMTKLQENLAVRADTRTTASDQGMMDRLRALYMTGENEGTTELNASMYSLRVESPQFRPERLLSVFDIAGEFFVNQENVRMPQLQLRNVDGIVVLVDVLSLLGQKEVQTLGSEVKKHRATAHNDDVIRGLVDHMDKVGAKRRGGKFSVPVHVVISKLDTASTLMTSPDADDALVDLYEAFVTGGRYPATAQERDKVCRQFIASRGEMNLLALLEGSFSTVHFYATSATGGELRRGKALRPWPRLLAPVADIVEGGDASLYSLIKNGGI